jgi:hypothetical protein
MVVVHSIRSKVYRWHARFRDDRRDVKDDATRAHTPTARTDGKIEADVRPLTGDRRISPTTDYKKFKHRQVHQALVLRPSCISKWA